MCSLSVYYSRNVSSDVIMPLPSCANVEVLGICVRGRFFSTTKDPVGVVDIHIWCYLAKFWRLRESLWCS